MRPILGLLLGLLWVALVRGFYGAGGGKVLRLALQSSRRGAPYPGAPIPGEKKKQTSAAGVSGKGKTIAARGPARKEEPVTDENDDDNDLVPAAKDIKLGDQERLQKVIARAGISSRRGAETLILDGRVVVNGKVVSEVGTKVNAKKDIILVDGKKLVLPDAKGTFWVVVNKPKSVLTTMDDDKKDKERRTVLDLVPKARELRLVPVGPMERDSTGLVVLTNDVGWIHALTHHSYVQTRRYEVVVSAFPEEAQLDMLRKGGYTLPQDARMGLELPPMRPCTVNIIDVDNTGGLVLLDVAIEETRPQQVQGMMELINCPVVSIKRTGMATLKLAGLRRGQWKELTSAEVEKLKASVHKAPAPPAALAGGSKATLGGLLRKRRIGGGGGGSGGRPRGLQGTGKGKPGSGYKARTAHIGQSEKPASK